MPLLTSRRGQQRQSLPRWLRPCGQSSATSSARTGLGEVARPEVSAPRFDYVHGGISSTEDAPVRGNAPAAGPLRRDAVRGSRRCRGQGDS